MIETQGAKKNPLDRFVTQPGDFILTKDGKEIKIEDLPDEKPKEEKSKNESD